MRRGVLLLLGVTMLALAQAGASSSRPSVVGGQTATVAQAPWVVFVGADQQSCTGTLIDPTHVLTAGHCLYTETGQPIDPTTMWIWAGLSNLNGPLPGDTDQGIWVTAARIHPGYVWSGEGSQDDVAVLTLASPVTTTAVSQPIPLPPVNASLGVGETGEFYGYGSETGSQTEADGSLNHIELSITDQANCEGGDNAVWICTSNPAGSVCYGDSGGGLVLTTPSPMVIGVTTAVETVNCQAGDVSAFANVSAPEILDFIEGNPSPPIAPRRLAPASVSTPEFFDVGTKATCSPGSWSGTPTFSFTFVDAATQKVLQNGTNDTYVATAADVGLTVRCDVAATNAGGTGVDVADAGQQVELAPSIQAPPSVAGRRGRSVSLTVRVGGDLSEGATRVCVTAAAAVRNACASVPAAAAATHAVVAHPVLAIRKTAALGTSRITVTATLGEGRSVSVTSRLTVRR